MPDERMAYSQTLYVRVLYSTAQHLLGAHCSAVGDENACMYSRFGCNAQNALCAIIGMGKVDVATCGRGRFVI